MNWHIDDFAGGRVHMIGIGGSSMSGLAGLLAARGYRVSGSDSYESYLVGKVRAGGIHVAIGHRAENVKGAQLVIYSAAIGEENPERAEARRLLIPQMERATLLGQLMQGAGCSIAVSGTHGKTTTTAMLAQALIGAGMDPSVHVGGSFDFIGGSTRIGKGDAFIAEACEFNSSFLQMRPQISIVLNIEADHLDFYKDLDDIVNAFAKFAALLPPDGVLIGNGDDPRVRRVLKDHAGRTVTFGLGADNDWRAEGLSFDALGNAAFTAVLGGARLADVRLQVGGDFNALNALAALAAASEAGAALAPCAEALSQFTGVRRRLEHTGTVDGVRLYHDYGHNPAEMRGALSVIARQPHRRLFAVMQPHTYSRVKRLFDAYIPCCDIADEVLVTDICAARETDPGDIHSGMLVDAMRAAGQSAHWTPSFADTEAYLRANWQPGDIVLTMGCGNINELNEQIERNGETAG